MSVYMEQWSCAGSDRGWLPCGRATPCDARACSGGGSHHPPTVAVRVTMTTHKATTMRVAQ